MSCTASGIRLLPLELLDEITDYVAVSPQDLLTLRCVNKTLCSLVTPAAFREIVIHTTDKSTQGFLEVLVNADIARHVRVVQIIEEPVQYNSETELGQDERFKRVGNRLRGACFMLHLIPALESLVFTFFPDEYARTITYDGYGEDLTRHHFFQLDVLVGLAHNPNPLPALRSLQIDNWFAYPDELYDATPFKRIVASLRDLRFHVQDTDYKSDEDHFPAQDFWADVVGPRVLKPAANLESLAISCNLEFGSLYRLDLNMTTYPRLTSLSLSNFVWDDARLTQVVVLEAEGFIVRHGKTLKKLELHNCIICVPQDSLTPVRSWATVWNRFADELTELVDLVVVCDFCQRYAYFVQEYGFDTDATLLLHGTEQDAPALEALVTTVNGRRG